MQLSIIIPTINRRIELDELLNSIQNCVININFEVIIIDQNPSGFIEDIIDKYKAKLNISHHLVSFRGLSKAKNYGVQKALGEYLTFPDDDCKIYPKTYSKALETIASKKVDIVFGRCVDAIGNDSVLKFKKTSFYLNKNNMVGGFVEATGVIHRSVFEKGFYFDENMGVGCFHGAEEGFDWLYRILTQSTLKAYYSQEIIFYHPQTVLNKNSESAIKRVFSYSCGKAYLYRKHKMYFKYLKRILSILAIYPILIVFRNKYCKYYFVELLGLIVGFLIK